HALPRRPPARDHRSDRGGRPTLGPRQRPRRPHRGRRAATLPAGPLPADVAERHLRCATIKELYNDKGRASARPFLAFLLRPLPSEVLGPDLAMAFGRGRVRGRTLYSGDNRFVVQ